MKSTFCSLALLALAASSASAQEVPKTEKTKVTRADLARSYQRFERALQAHPKAAAERAADLNRKFDQATVAFFGGAYARAIQALDRLSESLEEREPASAGFALRLRPTRWAPGEAAPKLLVSRIYTTQRSLEGLRLRILRAGVQIREQPLELSSSGALQSAAQLDLEGLEPGVYGLALGANADSSVLTGRFTVLSKPLAARRRALETRLEKLARRDALATDCRARLRLLAQPREDDLATVLLDVNRLADELEAEVAALEAGQNPYRERAGDSWHALQRGERAVPYRVLAPASALERSASIPVVIAFHGVGGDENMFLYGYGAGELARQAERLGFLAVTPRSEHFIRDPGALSALLEVLARDYRIDPARVYLLGHSMGTGAVTRSLSSAPKRIAAVVCFSGGAGGGQVPTLSIRGTLDPFGGMTGRSKPHPKIEARRLPERGHTLLVGEELGNALDWLAKHPATSPKDAPAAPKPKRWF